MNTMEDLVREEFCCPIRHCPTIHRRHDGLSAFLFLLCTLGLAPPGHAIDPEFQAFFFQVCENPIGALATRCGETDAGAGDLSGESESSLNPSQTMASPNTSLAAASARSEQMRERAERARTDGEEVGVDLGPFNLLLNARHTDDTRERTVDEDQERGYESATSSVELGLDYRLSDRALLGGWLSWERSDLDFDREQPGNNFTPLGDAGSVEHESVGASLFASFQLTERAYLDLSAGYLDLQYDLERRSVFQESNRVVPQTNVLTEAETDGTETWAAATWGYHAPMGSWTFGPYLGVTWAETTVDGYDETDISGSGLALTVDDVERTSTAATGGLRLTRAVSMQNYVLLPQFRVEYIHEFGLDDLDSAVAFQLDARANQFRLQGDDPDRDYFNANLGVAGVFPNGWMPFFELQARLGHEDLDRYRIVAGLRVEL